MTELNAYKEISEVWVLYKDALRNYIFKIVKDHDMANELSHEVLMKVYSSCCSGRPILNIRSWLFQIAYNTCMDHFKRSGKTTELQGDFAEPESSEIFSNASEFVLPLLKLLPKKYSEPLELADIKGLSQQEVADKLNLSLTATKSRVQRARKLLKDQITECVNLEVDPSGQLTAFKVKGSCEALKCYAREKHK
ncbi:sigma-70 family RNA polymerase sigma factor [Salinimicrobium gaetbulicola]|uniref:Sigma-70 family RNA polymerase sigma factor n=1 Tax=Salinimicrobium gaetbulicola TaxID=999702 RepID=A0ABW3IKZ4_9FLAO